MNEYTDYHIAFRDGVWSGSQLFWRCPDDPVMPGPQLILRVAEARYQPPAENRLVEHVYIREAFPEGDIWHYRFAGIDPANTVSVMSTEADLKVIVPQGRP